MHWLLTNNIGLGLRNFAVHVKNGLTSKGEPARILFRESYLDDAALDKIVAYRDLLNSNPAEAALVRATTYKSLSEPIDGLQAAQLYSAWQLDPDLVFVIVAYRWIPTLAKFKALTGKDFRVVILSMDCAGDLLAGYEEYGISGPQLPCYDRDNLRLRHFITSHRFFDFNASPSDCEILVQGGGWQLGVENMADMLPDYRLSYVIQPEHFQSDVQKSGARCFADESHGFFNFSQSFPKFGPLAAEKHAAIDVGDTPGTLTLLGKSAAQITKPGGLSIMDSICTGRPLILRDPISGDERSNLEFCLKSGIGVMLQDFLAEPAKGLLLARMADRLKFMRSQATSLVDAIAQTAN